MKAIAYKTILVPHAGTQAGDIALQHAIHIAKKESSRIILLNIIPTWPSSAFDEYHEDEQSVKNQISSILSNMEEGVRKFLAERVAMCRLEGVSCEGIFRTGKPSDSITKYANENRIDLIVMAKKKKIADYKSLFKIGGVAKNVQEKAHCSILLVEIDEKTNNLSI